MIAYAYALSKGENTKENYSSKKLELLAVKWAITDVFRNYLLGAKIILYTDNNPLTYIFTTKKLPALEKTWLSALSSFDLDIIYRSGRNNVNANALSRRNFGKDIDQARGITDIMPLEINYSKNNKKSTTLEKENKQREGRNINNLELEQTQDIIINRVK